MASTATKYSRKFKIRLSPYTLIYKKGRFHYAVNPATRSYCRANDDMVVLLLHLKNPTSIHSLFRKHALPASFDYVFQELLEQQIVVISSELSPLLTTPAATRVVFDHLSIFPTNDCNLRCRYCYASGGSDKTEMPFDIIDIALEYFFKRLEKTPTKRVWLDFHGGGEPTVAFRKIKYATERFVGKCRSRGYEYHISMATNGCFNNTVRSWIIKNNLDLMVSFEGLADIQNELRPFQNGGRSHMVVMNNIRALLASNISLAVRSTITKEHASRMPYIVESLARLGVKDIHFEPCFEVGRSLDSRTEQPRWRDFAKYFCAAFQVALDRGADLRFSGLRFLDSPQLRFCGACGHNFAITPDGYITSCFEVVRPSDPAARIFIYGKVDLHKRTIIIDKKALLKLEQRTVNRIKQCRDCFMKYGCTGDCPVKSFRDTGSIFTTNETRCKLIREINSNIIKMLIDGKYMPGQTLGRFKYMGEKS